MAIHSIPCSSCQHPLPSGATFCPFCGAQLAEERAAETKVEAPVNPAIESMLPTVAYPAIEDVDLDERVVTRGRRPLLGALGAVVVVAVVAAGLVSGSMLADHAPTDRADAPPPPAQVVAKKAAPAAPRVKFAVRGVKHGFEVIANGEVVHTVRDAKGSRYKDLDARARSVDVRLQHVESRQKGRFAARVAEGHDEVVFTEGDHDFRVLDVTRVDARRMHSTPDIVANLLVDRLNAKIDSKRPNT